MAKGYPAGGPIERIQARFKSKTIDPVLSCDLVQALTELDSYYRERLDSYAVAVTELRDIIRKRGNL